MLCLACTHPTKEMKEASPGPSSSIAIFFISLRSSGFDLEFKLANDTKFSLQRYGQSLYDGLILFAPLTARFGGSVDQAVVLGFVDAGRDLILATDPSVSGSEVSDGPVLSLITKKLRALKKKYNRIVQLEESQARGKTLNKEQEDLLAHLVLDLLMTAQGGLHALRGIGQGSVTEMVTMPVLVLVLILVR